MKPTTERKHHPYSPSSLQARNACPKFKQRGGPVHAMAITGTMQHDAVESQIDNPALEDYRLMAVTECLEFCDSRAKLYPGGTILKESYLPIDDEKITVAEGDDVVTYEGTTAGYLDYAVVSADGTVAEIIDYKFGNNAVEPAATNLQGIAYGLGIFKLYPKLQSFHVWFIMPHLDFISEHKFTRDQFEELYLKVVVVVQRAIEANAFAANYDLARANCSSCLFCGLIGKCPKVADKVIELGQKYRPLEIPKTVTPSLINDPVDAATGIRLAAVVATWAEAFKKQASARSIENDKFIPEGYTLVETTKRKVLSARKLADLAKEFLPAEDQSKVEELFDIPIGELEKLISTAALRGEKEATVEKFGDAALANGSLEMGTPFAFLRQSRKQDTSKIAKS